MRKAALLLALLSHAPCHAADPVAAAAASPALPATPSALVPNGPRQLVRALRYTPSGRAFAIADGAETFNRPLYGGGTAFRVDAGDRPLFGLYLPGRGGVLRIGWDGPAGRRWAHEASSVVAVYHPGGYTYELRDPSLGDAALRLEVLSLHEAEGLILRASASAPLPGCSLVWTFGGIDGSRGRRSVDLGTEGMPVSQWWAFTPAQAVGNKAGAEGPSFTLEGGKFRIQGLCSHPDAVHSVLPAEQWGAPPSVSAASDVAAAPLAPVLKGHAPLPGPASAPLHLLLLNVAAETPPGAPDRDLSGLFERTEARRAAIASQVWVDTPDPFLNASVAALNAAADGVWDEPTGTVQHGAVAWRNRLLGWRGPYANDALGWHERARRHLRHWAARQNTAPVPPSLPAPDAKDNLARNEPALHTNGDMSGTHYDMNLVYVDALFRHLLWTGDKELARELWPVVERHLAWERRLFRRPYPLRSADSPAPSQAGAAAAADAASLPLYEAYCCIWASDDLWYSGGGVTHATAYNLWHNRMAARLASLLGHDGSAYEKEAELIERGLREHLWLPSLGRYAESREWLGSRYARSHPALWTFYHALDSGAADPRQAWQMSRYIDTHNASFPLEGPGIPGGGAYTLATTNWLPYAWSTNNVVMAESAHTSLALWQSGRRLHAWNLLRGALLDSMWTGLCPGNAGMCTGFDVHRRESQRDFADAVGTSTRAVLEGLFGVRPDALAGLLTLRPGLPPDWDRASLRHPSLDFNYTRSGLQERWTLTQRFSSPQALRLVVPALRDSVESVTVNGRPAAWSVVADAVGEPQLELRAGASESWDVRIDWKGRPPAEAERRPALAAFTGGTGQAALPVAADLAPATLLGVEDPQGATLSIATNGSRLEAGLAPLVGERSLFARVRQGDFTWLLPLRLSTRPAVELTQAAAGEPGAPAQGALSFRLLNNTGAPLPLEVSLPGRPEARGTLVLPPTPRGGPGGLSHAGTPLSLPAAGLAPGTHTLRLGWAGGSAEARASTWEAPLPAGLRPEPVYLDKHYNLRLRELLSQELLSPRSPFVSLAAPRHGFGSWCSPMKRFDIDDSGLRGLADRPLLGIPFSSPADPAAANAAVTSLWDKHPAELSIPLSGRASRLYLLMTGTTSSMQSRLDNAELVVRYADGGSERLALRNPDNWWPLEQDYLTDDHAFSRPGLVPPRLELATGRWRLPADYCPAGGRIPGGAATVLDLQLDPARELATLEVRPLANEIQVALLAATLLR